MKDTLPRAFFSYSRQDSEFVLKLAKDLREGGAQVWLDQLDIEPGQRWDSAIEQALASCSTLLLVLSPSSVASNNVMDEVSFALEEKRLVIPVLYQDCKLPFRLRRLQYVDVRTDYSRRLQELLRMLDARPARSAPLKAPAASAPADTSQAESARSTRKRDEAAAPHPHEQTGHERIEQERAACVSSKRESTTAEAAEPPHAQNPVAAATTAVEPVPSGSRRKLIMSAGGAAAVLIGAMWFGTGSKPDTKHHEDVLAQTAKISEEAKPYDPKQAHPAPVEKREPQFETRPAQLQPGDRWVSHFLQASQGPSVEALRPYFHDTVAPYYSLPTSDWPGIEKDKKRYFARFPQIRIKATGKPQITRTDQGEVIDVTIEYENTRKDGYVTTGTSQMTITVRSIDGAWKIVGIQERVRSGKGTAESQQLRKAEVERS